MITRYIDSPDEDGAAICEAVGIGEVAILACAIGVACPLLWTGDAAAGVEMRVEGALSE